ncbi:hypothetical protein, partial [Sutterella wadsworthensis]|uniref:hypothetical protein n=1 Tax=Sutterella wadsworthensis TaxID=40545 RepID=UPI003A8F3513
IKIKQFINRFSIIPPVAAWEVRCLNLCISGDLLTNHAELEFHSFRRSEEIMKKNTVFITRK